MYNYYESNVKIATDWACATLTKSGCQLFATEDGWDIQLPSGAWEAANNWRELVFTS